MILKYHHTDKGFCRVCFTTKGKVNPKNEYYLADDTYNSEHEIRNAIFTDQWKDLEGAIIACECFNNYFEIGEVCE